MNVIPPKVDFFPVNQPNYVNVFISHPIGTDITVTNETTLKVEEKIKDLLAEYIENDEKANVPADKRIIQSVIAQVGEGASDPSQGVAMGNTPNKARITINFVQSQHRGDIVTTDILKKIQSNLKDQFTADIEVTAVKNERRASNRSSN